jgi:hypothetical protein
MRSLLLVFGLLLPWALGVAALLALRETRVTKSPPGELAWLAGTGYLVGAIALTLWMRALSAVGIPFGTAAIALPLIAATLLLGYAALRRRRASLRTAMHGMLPLLRAPDEIGGVVRVVWWALIGWMALRFVLLGLDVAWQPLYPWDAWIEWATKARVWFELGRIVPFVDAAQWLAASDGVWFDASPHNPATLPLLQVWSCVVLGRWDDALMNWPWWQFAASLVLVVYGGLRRLEAGAFAALLGAYFTASLPLANVHVALAGYADLPLAACYTAGVLAFLHWNAARTLRAALGASFFVAALPLIATTGWIYVFTMLPGIVVAAMPRRGARVVAAAFALALFALAVLAQTHPVVAGRAWHLEFAPAWTELLDGYFIAGSWNVLWFGVLGAAVLAWRRLLAPPLAPLVVIVAAGTLYVLALWAFPALRVQFSDVPSVNRASLHLAALLIILMLLAFRAFAGHWRARHPAPADAPLADASPASATPVAAD